MRNSAKTLIFFVPKRILSSKPDLHCGIQITKAFSPGKNKLLRRAQTDQVVHGRAEFLFAAQLFLSSLHTDMPQQKLNLFQFTARKVTQAGARAP